MRRCVVIRRRKGERGNRKKQENEKMSAGMLIRILITIEVAACGCVAVNIAKDLKRMLCLWEEWRGRRDERQGRSGGRNPSKRNKGKCGGYED